MPAHYFSHSKIRLCYLKTIALTLIFCLVFQQFSNAAALEAVQLHESRDFSEKQKNLEWAKRLLPGIPVSIASIEDAWQTQLSGNTVILIQDAHTNSSAQFNESKLLDLLLNAIPKIQKTIPNATEES